MNRKILLICYYFPPMGLAGVGRPLSLFKKLPAADYECHALTVKPVTYWAYEPELLDGCDQDKIFRAGSHDPQRLMYLLGIRRMKQSVAGTTRKVTERFFPDSKVGWVRSAIRLGRTLLENYRYDAILSTSPPVSSHLIARRLASEFKVPWVADFRDFWTSNRVEDVYEKAGLVARGRKLLEQIVSQASAVTAVTPAVVHYLGAGEIIANGFDDRVEDWRMQPDSEYLVIGLPGNVDDAESIRPLFEVLASLRLDDEAGFDRIRMLQVGAVDRSWLVSVLNQYGLEDRCDIMGHQPRARCIKILSRASLFYLGLSGRLDPDTIPSRIFELLASGRPILAFAPVGSAPGAMIENNRAGFCFGEDGFQQAVDYLRLHISDFVSGSRTINPLPGFSSKFSSEVMVQKFVRVLDGLR
jgi:glycosyltransferase involved in cell wall biosynthesis